MNINILATQEIAISNINNIFYKYSKISLALTYTGFLILLIFHLYINRSPSPSEADSDFPM
jgi:hypothetical protein